MLSLQEINNYMQRLNSWDLDLNSLTKIISFENSAKLLIFLDKLMETSDELNHYPEITIKGKTLKLNLITTEENNVSIKDFALAESIDKIALS
jgi:4a-hydroxytetrahydrobiopterin dehydratase